MKQLLISFFVIPVVLFSQDKSTGDRLDIRNKPVLSVSSDLFKLRNMCFSKFQYDISGETLETVFQIENLTNAQLQFYIFVIASYELDHITKFSSFDRPIPIDDNLIKNIQAYPGDIANFEYTETDENGVDKKVYQKYPKNIKAGIDQETGKPHIVHDTIIFRSKHFSKFVKNYHFFNTVTILVFDADDEKLVFCQNYRVRPIRR